MKTNERRICIKCKKTIFVSISQDLAGQLIETHFIGLKKIIDDHPAQDVKSFFCGSCKGGTESNSKTVKKPAKKKNK